MVVAQRETDGKMPVLESTSDQKYQHQLPTVSFRVVGDEKTYLSAVGVSSVSLPQDRTLVVYSC